jgi:hypothetical protein
MHLALCRSRSLPAAILLTLVLVAQAASATAAEDKAKAAKKACVSGDYAKGVELLSDLYVETNDLNVLRRPGHPRRRVDHELLVTNPRPSIFSGIAAISQVGWPPNMSTRRKSAADQADPRSGSSSPASVACQPCLLPPMPAGASFLSKGARCALPLQ